MNVTTIVRLSDLRLRIAKKTVSIKHPFPDVIGDLEGRVLNVGYRHTQIRKKDGTVVGLETDRVKQLWVLGHIRVLNRGKPEKPASKLASRPHRNPDNIFTVVSAEKARGRYAVLLQHTKKRSFNLSDIERKLTQLNERNVIPIKKFASVNVAAKHFVRELLRDKAIKVKKLKPTDRKFLPS